MAKRKSRLKTKKQIFIPTTKLAPEQYRWALERGADAALAENRVAVVVGIRGDNLLVCTDNCCIDRKDAMFVVPDVLMVEFAANYSMPDSWSLQRDDGRSAYIYRSPRDQQ
mgnify:CR=1 FL=1